MVGFAELLELAVEGADGGGDLGSRRGGHGGEVSDTKSSPVDIVTEVDKAAEQLIFDRLMSARPGDGFLGEAGASPDSTTGIEWVVDPIDGTVNFVYGLPLYAVSIAAAMDGESVAGVVVNVETGEQFTATRGGGAFLADERLLLQPADKPLSQRLVATGFNYIERVKLAQTSAVSRMLHEVRDIRRLGSAAPGLFPGAARPGRPDR